MDCRARILDLAREKGIIRSKDVEECGCSRNYLYEMRRAGDLRRLSAGLYALPDAPVTEHSLLAEVAKRVPQGVVCLISALAHHGLSTQIPHEIWLTVPKGFRRPRIAYPPLNLTYVSGQAYSFGVREHVMGGVPVRIYSPAKTVADCFKFRSKVGLDVALEALREAWRSRKATVDELMEAAEIDRVSKVMRPYLEVIV